VNGTGRTPLTYETSLEGWPSVRARFTVPAFILERAARLIAHENALTARCATFSPQSHTSRHRARRGAGDGVVTR
jgi:hypothetical protein